ncbi:uncharacterized protein LOC110275721 [Arachis duranensis]|uniref:Uncharacterized protein LOC110275721 n=1 Tax=Arachis duranensis TaxID=130453 RepID=A0A6P5MQN1_ARADU|nr:uncharacterized protein LOC110275721 [Arachis duranensis]
MAQTVEDTSEVSRQPQKFFKVVSTCQHSSRMPDSLFLNFDAKAVGEKRLLQLNELAEFRLAAFENAKIYKERAKKWHNRKISSSVFELSEKVLLFNSRLKLFPGKLKSCWTGPFVVTTVSPYGHIELQSRHSDERFIVNGQRVKHYLGGEVEQERSTLLLT